ncbi:hypothetical protein F8M41_022248 [Gigaspora margarita]|uniref:Uncharacterized protein n=1 Tax=Gigaspora margarita TaxID=4874 RepID=A0A8H4AFD9_GIGMA|nr:hypothetical protein F8M41_022248 [Gigaspora margarita]
MNSKELLCHFTEGFLFLSIFIPNSFARPFDLREQFAPLSINAPGFGYEISASGCISSEAFWDSVFACWVTRSDIGCKISLTSYSSESLSELLDSLVSEELDPDSFHEHAKVLVSSSFLLDVILFSLSLESEDDSFEIIWALTRFDCPDFFFLVLDFDFDLVL